MQELKSCFLRRGLAASPSPVYSSISAPPGPSPLPPPQGKSGTCVYGVTSYSADPTGKSDSTEAILRAISDAYNGPNEGFLMDGITNLGGAEIHLEGGNYLISKPLWLPAAGAGNLMIHGGTLRASDNFATDGYLIDLSASSSSSYFYEYITLKDLMLNSNFRGGGISVVKSLRIRTSIDNCYI